ncbi:MAG: MaoC/PaaZ C-terminal domain-containing protein [Chloroflexi bacterium]|nr:MaoC/PaaZ C-terminal domain-containing protein [Chloroflexota bacterium]
MTTQARRQAYFEDYEVGSEIPKLVKGPMTTQMMMRWGAAVGDYYQIHYDPNFARDVAKLPSIIVHGTNKFGILGQFLTGFVGDEGWVRKIAVSYRAMDYPADTITARGVVTNKYEQDGQAFIELEIWTENPKGEKTTPGSAVVMLPKRS